MVNTLNLDPEVIAKVAGPALSLIVGGLVKHYVEARSKVVSFIGHASAFTLQGENPMAIHTHSVVVRNTGRKAAKNVRLIHAVLPINMPFIHPFSIPSSGTLKVPEGSSSLSSSQRNRSPCPTSTFRRYFGVRST
jgi:hypothetical protein